MKRLSKNETFQRAAKALSFITLLLCALTFVSSALAANTSGITYQGRILKPDGSPLEGANVQFRLEIRSPNTSRCLMFAEVQTRDMRNSKGVFALTMNDGTGARVDTSTLGFDRVFANRGALTFDPATCSSGSSYTPNEDDGRILSVSFKDETMTAWEPMPAQSINFVPFAIEAKQIAGFGINGLLRFDLPTASPKNASPLSEAEYDKLTALIAGTSADYERAGRLGGALVPSTAGLSNGQVLSWNGTAWVGTDAVPDAAISTAKIIDAAITSQKIADGTITGADLSANIAINTTNTIQTSGTVSSNLSTARDFRLYDSDAAPNENYISLKAPTSLSQNYNYVWPGSYGTASQVLTTDGSGNLSWAAPAASTQWSNGSSGAIYYNGGNIGVGTATPTAAIDIATAGTALKVGSASFLGSSIDFSIGRGAVGFASGTPAYAFLKSGIGHSIGLFTNGSGTPSMVINTSGASGIGVLSPTATLQLKAGGTAAGSAPLKLTSSTSGVLLTTPEDGAMEYDGTGLYFTIGSTRYVISTNTTAGNYSNVSTISNTSSINVTTPSGSSVLINSGTSSLNTTSGALVVTGGAGISGALNVGGAVNASSVVASSTLTVPQVYGSSAANGNLKLDGSSTAPSGYVLLNTGGGNVGIGTTTPATKLHVAGTTRLEGNSSVYNGSSLTFSDSGLDRTTTLQHVNDADFRITTSTGHISLMPGTSSNVGIGLTSPTAPLDVVGAITARGVVNSGSSSAAQNGSFNLFTNSGALAGYTAGTASGLSLVSSLANQPLVISTSNGTVGERMRITGDGKVGIGTTAPTEMLHVAGNTTVTGALSAGYIFSNNVPIFRSINSPGGTTGYWTRIANLQMNQRYQYLNAVYSLHSGNVFARGINARVYFRVVQTNPMASAPYINIEVDSSSTTLKNSDVVAVLTSNTASLTEVGLYVRLNNDYDQLTYSNLGLATWNSSLDQAPTALAAALPAGTQTAGITGLTKWDLGTTSNSIAYTAGNVGIGTAAPDSLLDLKSARPNLSMKATSLNHGMTTLTSTDTALELTTGIGSNGGGALTGYAGGSGNALSFYSILNTPTALSNAFLITASKKNGTANQALASGDNLFSIRNYTTDLLLVKGSGNVGIGTTAPFSKLSLKQSAEAPSGGLYLQRTSNADTWAQYVGNNGRLHFGFANSASGADADADFSSYLVIDNAGNVGIGTTTPSEKLSVVGNITATGTITGSSDRRLKKNIMPITDALDRVLQLNGYYYDWKNPAEHSHGRQIGVIAQEVEKVFPEAVLTDKNGYKSVSYMALVAPVINAVKQLASGQAEQQRSIASLEEEASAKDRKIRELESEMNAMKAYICQKDPAAPVCH